MCTVEISNGVFAILAVTVIILAVILRRSERSEKMIATQWVCPNATWACNPGMKLVKTERDQSQNHNWFCLGDSDDYLMPRLRRICD